MLTTFNIVEKNFKKILHYHHYVQRVVSESNNFLLCKKKVMRRNIPSILDLSNHPIIIFLCISKSNRSRFKCYKIDFVKRKMNFNVRRLISGDIRIMKRIIYASVYVAGITLVVFATYNILIHRYDDDKSINNLFAHPIERPRTNENHLLAISESPITNILLEKYNDFEVKSRMLREKIKMLQSNSVERPPAVNGDHIMPLNRSTKNIHIFYSAPVQWYKPYNTSIVRDAGATIEINELNSVFYPMLGLYTTTNKILEHHFNNIKRLGINVIIMTWKPSSNIFPGESMDLLKMILNFVKKYYDSELQVALEIDSYPGRTVESIRNILTMLHREYLWSHPGIYRVHVKSKNIFVPMVYIRDAYQISDEEWFKIFSVRGIGSVRNTIYDAVFIGHVR